jgi:hypothetical protein
MILLQETKSQRQLRQYIDRNTGLTTQGSGFDSRQEHNFFFIDSRPALGPSQLPTQYVLGSLSTGVKRLGHKAYHPHPSNAEINTAWSYTSTPPYVFLVAQRQPILLHLTYDLSCILFKYLNIEIYFKYIY